MTSQHTNLDFLHINEVSSYSLVKMGSSILIWNRFTNERHSTTISLRSRRLQVVGQEKTGAREGDTRGERKRLHGRPPKIVSRPLSNYLAAVA